MIRYARLVFPGHFGSNMINSTTTLGGNFGCDRAKSRMNITNKNWHPYETNYDMFTTTHKLSISALVD